MRGRCSHCRQSVAIYTVKDGGLFDPDTPYEVCFKHNSSSGLFSKVCIGSETRPETIWQEDDTYKLS